MDREVVFRPNIAVGAPRPLWCERCLTSAAFECDLYSLHDAGMTPIGLVGACTRCDPHLFGPDGGGE